MRSSDKRKNTNTKIDLFSTNSTLSFLNIKDNNKEIAKPVKIKCFDYNNKMKKIFSSNLIERKIRQKTRSDYKQKIKHIKNNFNLDKNSKKISKKNQKYSVKDNNNFNNSNKSIEFCISYMKPINKRRNLSLGIFENSNSNTNSIQDLYKKKVKNNNLNSSNLLFDNLSFSQNKNNEFGYNKGRGSSFSKKLNLNTYWKKTINKNNNSKTKFSLSSLPNLLCNNYLNKHNNTMSKNDIFNNNKKNTIYNYNNKSSYKNLFEEKKCNKNHIKLTNKIFNSYKNNSIVNKINNNIKKEEITCENNKNSMNNKLKNIHFGIKSLLDGLYTIYLNANNNMNNVK